MKRIVCRPKLYNLQTKKDYEFQLVNLNMLPLYALQFVLTF